MTKPLITIIAAITWYSLYVEQAINAMRDSAFLIFACFIIIIVDLWYAWHEHRYEYHQCKSEKERNYYLSHHSWRTSRAVRSTAIKFVDYLSLLIAGCVIGLAFTEPYGLCSHIVVSRIGISIGIFCDVISIIGHILVVKGFGKISSFKIVRVIAIFVSHAIKKESEEISEAIHEVVEESKDKQ